MTAKETLQNHIPYNVIEEITIPSIQELHLIDQKTVIRTYDYWLRDHQTTHEDAAIYIDTNGIYTYGNIKEGKAVRPILKVNKNYYIDKNKQFFIIAKEIWTNVGNNLLLFESYPPHWSMFDDNINYYDQSLIKKYVDGWWEKIKKVNSYSVIPFNENKAYAESYVEDKSEIYTYVNKYTNNYVVNNYTGQVVEIECH